MAPVHDKSDDDWVLFAQGFRPFFLAAAGWAVIAIPIWIWTLMTGAAFPSRFDPMNWHIHEMLFGFVMAAVAGFLLTAIPNWTGRLPLKGAPLAILAGLWLLGRIVCLMSALMPAWLATALDLAFPVALIFAVWREVVAGRNWRNLIVLVPVTVLGACNLLMHLQAMGMGVPDGMAWRLALAGVAMLITIVGGRITPSFTRNWLAKHAPEQLPAPFGWPDRAALVLMAGALLGWAFVPSPPTGWLALVAAAVNLWRLTRWRGLRTAGEPLLLVLHAGYFWLTLSVALIGLSLLTAAVPEPAAVHALTVGAFGTMIVAVMTRATRGHSGRPLAADRATTAIFVLINLAAVARVAAEFLPNQALWLFALAAVLWVAAFLLFLAAYGPMLLFRRSA